MKIFGVVKETGTGRGRLLAVLTAGAALLAALPHPPAVAEVTALQADSSGSRLLVRPLSLDEARRLALAGNEQVAQMREVVRGAEADVLGADADRLPHLEVGGTWTRNLKKPAFFLPEEFSAGFGGATSVEMGGDWDLQAAATVTLNLWTAGRLSAARGLAAQALEASRWQEQVVRDAVVYSVETAYFQSLLARSQVAIAEAALDLAEETERVAREAHDQGRASRFDLLRARVELTNRQAPVVQARNRWNLARQQLLRICGLDPDTELELTDPLQTVAPPAALDTLLDEMRNSSPELRSLEHSVQAARLAVNLARAGRGPVVRLQGRYALQGQWDGDLFPGEKETATSASAALGVSLPLFDGFAARADIQGREADLKVAALELERVTRDRELGVRQARTRLEDALTALEGRREGVDLAEEAYRLAVIRLENGLATPLERLDADLALTEARVQLLQALYACNTAAANLELAVGGAAGPAASQEMGQ